MNRIFLAAAAAVALCTSVARGELKSYYVSHDTREVFTSGTYVGLSDPNFNHLTLIEASPHSDHFHAIAAFTYTGDPASPTVITSGESRVPPVSHGAPTTWIQLVPGDNGSIYDGKLVTASGADPYSDLTLSSVSSLDGFADGTIEHTYFNSSGGRWSQPFADGTELAIELVSLDAGLHVGTPAELDVLSTPGQTLSLGDANTLDALPVLWMDAGTAPGQYAAEFRLIDASQTYGESGVFSINVEVVPEPAAVVSALLGAVALFPLLRGRMFARRGT